MRDFEDFRDAVLNKISALEVSDDEKWEKLCKVLIFCLVKSSYGPHVQNLELHLKHRSNGHLRKLCKIRNFSQSPFGGFIFEESDGNFPSGRN